MKSDKGRIAAQVDRPDPAIRFYLFCGADESAARGFADRLLAALKAEKVALTGSELRSDPARLADEAGAIGLFGGARLIWIEPAADETTAAVQALLDAPAIESPVVAIGGALRKTSSLLKLAEGSPAALALTTYAPDARDLERTVLTLGQQLGLRIRPDVARRVAEASGGDQAIARQELAKFALYLDASPDIPGELDHETIDAVGADASEGEGARAGDLALAGAIDELLVELDRLGTVGTEAIPLIRGMQRRLLLLAPLRARIEAGEGADAVLASLGKALFWKDKPVVSRMVRAWSAARLAQLSTRLTQLERSLMLTSAPADAMLGEELLAIARAAHRR